MNISLKNKLPYIFLIVAISIVSYINYLRYFHMAGDSAAYVDLIRRAGEYLDMNSKVFASAHPLYGLIGQSFEAYCNNNFVSQFENWSNNNWHLYLIAVPMGIIAKILHIDPVVFASIIAGISMCSIFWLILLINKNFSINNLYSLLIVTTFLFFPPVLGSLSGQYYFDRLYIPIILGIYLVIRFNHTNINWLYLISLMLLGIMASERSSLMSGLFVVLIFIIEKVKDRKMLIAGLFMSILAVSNYLFWKSNIANSPFNDKISYSSILYNFNLIFDKNNALSAQSAMLVTICAPILFVSAFSPKYLILALLFMLPNFIVTMGGSEKIGFVTHYHTFYIPILIISFINGFVVIKKLGIKIVPILVLIITTAISFNSYANRLYVVSPTLTHDYFKDSLIIFRSSDIGTYSGGRREKISSLMDDVNRDDFVSSNEFMQPILVSLGFRNLRYFPVGLSDSKYILMENTVNEPNLLLMNIYQDSNYPTIQSCLYERLDKNYRRYKDITINGISYVLWKK